LYRVPLHVAVNTAQLSTVRSVAWGWHDACLGFALTMPRYGRYGFDVRAVSTSHECAKTDVTKVCRRCRHARRAAARSQRASRKPQRTGSQASWTCLLGWRF